MGYSVLTGNNCFLLEDRDECETVIFYFPKQDRNEPFIFAMGSIQPIFTKYYKYYNVPLI